MGIVSKLFGDDSSAARRQTTASPDYIDLSDYGANGGAETAATTMVRFAELRSLDDLKQFASFVYDGSMLILDFKAVQSDEILLRRLTNELRKIAQDTGGDIAGLGDHHILLTPAGVKVDRRKIAAPKEEVAHVPRTGPSSPGAPARSNGTRR